MNRTWREWAKTLLPRVTAPGARILIDGRSGSGKSTLAAELVALAADRGIRVQLEHLEDIYPGWDGLEAGAHTLVTEILEPLVESGSANWRTYDWFAAAPGRWLTANATDPLIVEGAGALTRASSALATYSIWVEADEAFRQTRAFARDGDTYRPHWQRWADQEVALIARENSPQLANLVIDATQVEDSD